MEQLSLVLFSILIFLIGCTNKENNKIRDKVIPPDHCRIIAEIISIDSTLTSTRSSDPCSKAPCKANLVIKSVVGYGSNFGTTLSTGDKLEVVFVYTTARSSPELSSNGKYYEGVNTGSRILADLRSRTKLKSADTEFFIYGYEVIEQQ